MTTLSDVGGFDAQTHQLPPAIKPSDRSDRARTAADAKAAAARNAVQSLETALEKAKETRRTMAAARVQQLREQLRILRWFAATDPKSAARQAARMNQELRSAVRDYTNPTPSMPRAITEIPQPTPDESGEDIRNRLRAQLAQLMDMKAALESEPRNAAFVTDALALRFGIQGLVEAAKFGGRADSYVRRDIGTAARALNEVDLTLGGFGRRSVSILA